MDDLRIWIFNLLIQWAKRNIRKAGSQPVQGTDTKEHIASWVLILEYWFWFGFATDDQMECAPEPFLSDETHYR